MIELVDSNAHQEIRLRWRLRSQVTGDFRRASFTRKILESCRYSVLEADAKSGSWDEQIID